MGGTVCFDIMIHAEQILKMKQRINEILSNNTGQPLEKIIDTDRFMSAEAAMEYGAVDEVITFRNRLFKR